MRRSGRSIYQHVTIVYLHIGKWLQMSKRSRKSKRRICGHKFESNEARERGFCSARLDPVLLLPNPMVPFFRFLEFLKLRLIFVLKPFLFLNLSLPLGHFLLLSFDHVFKGWRVDIFDHYFRMVNCFSYSFSIFFTESKLK